MSNSITNIFNKSDLIQIKSLSHRVNRNNIINANIANAETPKYRSLNYDFEAQLQELNNGNDLNSVMNKNIQPHIYFTPSESVNDDGNNVDVDGEMSKLAQNPDSLS